MTVDDALYSYLTGVAAVTALISTRLYPEEMPQNPTLPACTYKQVSGSRRHRMGARGVARPRYQITSWGQTLKSARSVAEEVEIALATQSNQLWGGAGGVTVSVMGPENEISDYVRMESGVYQYAVNQDYIITRIPG